MNNNIIAKLVGSIIAIIVMGVIIFFVYQYYDNEAKKTPNDNYSPSSDTETSPDSDSKKKSNNYTIEDYDKTRQIIVVNDKKVVLNYELSDGGSVITFNENPVSYAPNNSQIKYIVTKKYFILFVDDYDSGDLVMIIDDEGNVVNTFSTISLNNVRYIVNDPIVKEKNISSFELKNNTLYITYVLDDFDYANGIEDIQFSYVFDLNNDDFINEEKIVNKYKEIE